MVTHHRNIRVSDHPWEPAGDRAREQFGTTRSEVIRAFLEAFCAGEADDLVAKWLPSAAGGQGQPPAASG